MMKDELNSNIITEAYFLGIKEYGYKYIEEYNQVIERSLEFLEIVYLLKIS
jgi:hypothetical protein